MDIKYSNRTIDIRPTKTELKQAEATVALLRIVALNTDIPTVKKQAECGATDLSNVLASLHVDATSGD